MSRIFLSYAGTDRAQAVRLQQGLEAVGADVWLDQDDIRLGDQWIDRLEQGLTGCSAYLILIGTGGVQRWVKLELGVALKRHVDTNGVFPIFPLRLPGVEPDDLPPFLGNFQARALPTDPSEDDYRQVAEAIAAASAAGEIIPLSPVCPYPGLECYTEATAGFFFGRRGETLKALALLGSTRDGSYRRWLQIEGPSGVGKSSLVQGGMIPAMRRGWIEARGGTEARDWLFALMRPGHEPLLNLAQSLFQALPAAGDFGALRAKLAGSSDALRDVCRQHLAGTRRLLLAVDQLEEVFTLTDDNTSREQFDALLATALADRDGAFHLITTIRSDFTLHLPHLTKLQAILDTGSERYYLQPVDRTGLRDVVTTPTRRAGLGWDEPGLPERIVEEAAKETNPLPLVSNLLSLLWQRRKERGDALLRDADHRELGGVGGALGAGADRLIEGLGKDGAAGARKLLLQLVRVNRNSAPTRRTVLRTQCVLAAGGGATGERILARLSGGAGEDGTPAPRLVAVWNPKGEQGSRAEDRVDLAHETLLTRWATLQGWVATHRDQIEADEALEDVAEHWEQAGRPRFPGLPAAAMLKRYRRAAAPSPRAEDYLKAVRRQQMASWAGWSFGTMLVGLLAVFLGWVGAEGYPLGTGVYALLARSGLYTLQPEMVPITGGTFQMGSPADEKDGSDDERQHPVTVGDFAIGRYEVTFEEYDVFTLATGRPKVGDENWGRGRRPVINVSWQDANDYAAWLRAQTGQPYRLPTEAEWEYAARGGKSTAYWWGGEMEAGRANCRGCGGVVTGKTSSAGSFGKNGENAFGLYDTAGNVWEWTGSVYTEQGYDGSESRLAERDAEGSRVLRGGSWSGGPRLLRSARRYWSVPYGRSDDIGFRLAQD